MNLLLRLIQISVLVALSLSCQAQTRTIRISNGEWAPFMGKELPGHGLVTRVATEAFRLGGVRAEYEFFPWARAYYAAQAGDFDASIGWYWNEERARDFLFSDPVFVERQVFFHLKNQRFDWNTMADLRGKTIGATIGYTYGDEFKNAEATKLFDVRRVSADEQNIKILLAGRVDAIVMSQAVGEDLLRHTVTAAEASRVTFNPKPVNSGPLHLIFPKAKSGSAEWLAIFNRGLAEMKARGQLNLKK